MESPAAAAGSGTPSYAGLRVDVLERADGDLMIRYQGEAVDYQEGPPPSSALWGAVAPCSPGPERQEGADGVVNSHLNEAQRERLAALESSESSDETNDEDVAAKGRGGKTKPVRHAPDAHGDPAGSLGGGTTGQGALSLRAIRLGMARDTVGKTSESPPTKKLSARDRTKADPGRITDRHRLNLGHIRFSFKGTQSLDYNTPAQLENQSGEPMMDQEISGPSRWAPPRWSGVGCRCVEEGV